ncbi:hypothetical protein GGR28_000748 [Lewinella aquimaris]|uniref:DUF4249 domain-containing protein n=1 Tax=Neolewinella aquimaris TaxID=1835722 RepID=A0A840E4U9_9BACT|nr:DUF4249 domain-containing protein [Neolewinella aquimaris]MBB4078147.1 hypothetical protein [Neolewinella aquimaris]
MRIFAYYLRCCTVAAGCCLTLLFACEEPVELNIDIPKSRLVINSNFYPNELVVLRISSTRPIGGVSHANIDNAEVSLFEGTELAESLEYLPDPETAGAGSYRTKVFRPKVGQQYTIHVAAEGYDPVTAVSSIPDPIAITSIAINGLTKMTVDDLTTYDYSLLIDYADPVEETNYYDLRIYQEVIGYKMSAKGDTVRQSAYLKSVGTPTRAAGQGATVSVLLRDKCQMNAIEVHLQSQLDASRELPGEIVAELRTVSPEYYFYKRSLLGYEGTSLPLNEPVILFNNVDQGLGVFAGYNSVQQKLLLLPE